MFSEFSHWNRVSDAYCRNNEKHSTGGTVGKHQTVEECKAYCRGRDWCIGVSFSSYWVRRVGNSKCYFCYEAASDSITPNYDIYIRPGNPELIVF